MWHPRWVINNSGVYTGSGVLVSEINGEINSRLHLAFTTYTRLAMSD
jgi:hypothetical protein